MDRTLLERKSVAELREIAATLGLKGFQRLKKAELIDLLLSSASQGDPSDADGTGGHETRADGPQAAGGDSGGGATDGQRGDDRSAATDGDRSPSEGGGRTRARGGRQRAGQQDDRGDGVDTAKGGREEAQGHGRGGDRDQDRQGRDRKRGRDRGDDRPDDRGGDRPNDRGNDRGNDRPSDRGNDRGADRPNDRGNDRGKERGRAGEEDSDAEVREGVLDLLPEGYGFLRCTGYLAGSQDVYVSQSFVRRFDLRRGDLISGPIRRNRNSDKFPALARVEHVEGQEFDPRGDDRHRPAFADLVALPPSSRLSLGAATDQPTPRLVDLLTPLGRGQRALVLAPPRAGKTAVLKDLARAMRDADVDLELLALLVDERPEEVTAVERSTGAEVVATTFDRSPEDHTQVAELVVERAKRLAERGRDVVVFLDSLTRLARAYNTVVPSSGRVLPGGVDPAALAPAKRLFAAARDLEGAGSLTIVATVVVGTGSRMDEVIAEGFTDTANMELHLDGSLAQQRRYPAVDVVASGTRGEEELLTAEELAGARQLRRSLARATPEDALEQVLGHLEAAPDTAALLERITRSG